MPCVSAWRLAEGVKRKSIRYIAAEVEWYAHGWTFLRTAERRRDLERHVAEVSPRFYIAITSIVSITFI
ncbi:hypothetical protein M0804_004369 [Polistes exclamans]|nr:hypothetical protein M0804_004369 [Polistes exclamans]